MQFLIGFIVALAFALMAYLLRLISISGVIGGVIFGTIIYGTTDWRGFAIPLVFFIIGNLCTKHGYKKKDKLGIAQEEGGKRGAKHALANILAGTLFALLAYFLRFDNLGSKVEACIRLSFIVAMVGSFATAAADTSSSEIGQVYGKTPINPLTFKKVKPGTEGAISLEGTAVGILASLVVALIGILTGLYEISLKSFVSQEEGVPQIIFDIIGAEILLIAVISVVLGAFLGNMLESLIGAAGGKNLNNELLNFMNTFAGGLISGILMLIISYKFFISIPIICNVVINQ